MQILPHSWRRGAAALAACAALASNAWAQATPPTPATPPAKADIVLRGAVAGARELRSQADCQAACQATSGCSGYTFQVPGYSREAAKTNCTLYSGSLSEAPLSGFVSCRMPCIVTAPTPVHNTRLLNSAELSLKAPAPAALTATAPVLTTRLPPPPPPMAKPGNARAAGPTPTPPPAPAPAAPHSAVSGYEIVAGPTVNVAPLSIASTSAQCPAGKVALSGGVDFSAAGDASFGLEVQGVIPDARLATVNVRNANVFVPARVRALAVCVNAIAGLRVVNFGAGGMSAGEPVSRLDAGCNAGERVVGGGVLGREQTFVGANGPQMNAAGAAVWRQYAVAASPVALPGTVGVDARVLCAPQAAADGWEFVESAPVSLGARSQTTLTLACPAGKVVLGAGLVQRSTNYLDLVANNLLPTADGRVTAHLHNRNTLGTSGNVQAVLAGLCASRQ